MFHQQTFIRTLIMSSRTDKQNSNTTLHNHTRRKKRAISIYIFYATISSYDIIFVYIVLLIFLFCYVT